MKNQREDIQDQENKNKKTQTKGIYYQCKHVCDRSKLNLG